MVFFSNPVLPSYPVSQVLVHKIYVHALSRTTARLVSMEMQDKLVQREVRISNP